MGLIFQNGENALATFKAFDLVIVYIYRVYCQNNYSLNIPMFHIIGKMIIKLEVRLAFIDRIPPSTKGFDNAFHKRPHVTRVLSSPDVQSDQPSVPHVNQNNLINLTSGEGM